MLAAGLMVAVEASGAECGLGGENCAPLVSGGAQSTFLSTRLLAIGPLYEWDADGSIETTAVHPFFATSWDSTTDSGWTGVLYPLFTRRQYPGGERWNLLEMAVGAESTSESGHPVRRLELWPFYWHYDNGVREESYDAVFPLAGTVRNHLFCKRIDWFLFPAFLRLEKGDHRDTYLPFPFFRYRTGGGASGAAFWPLGGHFEQKGENASSETFALWPIFYDDVRTIPERRGGGQYRTLGVLPLYAQETAPGLTSRTFLWPFFGYTTEAAPRPEYSEIRWLYPLVVTGSGKEKSVRRFLPLYTHEEKTGYRKSWYLWPLLKREDSRVTSVDVHKDHLLYFLYKNEVQTSLGTDFKARKTQVWPLFGYVNDGKGKRQLQVLNLFEPIFGGNEQIRKTWTPLFAIYREEEASDELRRSLLWNLVLYDRNGKRWDFSVGPFFRRTKGEGGSSWSVARGLISRENDDEGAHWSALWGLFGTKGGKK